MQSIVGTWKLLHATARDAAGAARPLPCGGKALGRLTLTADAFRSFEFYFVATGLYLAMALGFRGGLSAIYWAVFQRGRAA